MYRLIWHIFLLSLLGSISTATYAQKEASIWHFGQNAGLRFLEDTVVTINDSPLASIEGCATISDPDGNLLFFTDGITVYDRFNDPMPNGFGLEGSSTSTQGALIVRKPGSEHIFYIFTADAGPYDYPPFMTGVHYSVVNMCLNGGRGDVVANSKNTLLFKPNTEKLNAVMHQNGTDVWVMAHEYGTDRFMTYLVTEEGVNPTPIINYGEVVHAGPTTAVGIGALKFSPNGRRVCTVDLFIRTIELYDFDNQTGLLSNPITIQLDSADYAAYGIAFSQDNSKIYLSTNRYLWQYDISVYDSMAIANSRYAVWDNETGQGARVDGLQLGPNGKIYASFGITRVSVIHNPNATGAAVDFELDAIRFASFDVHPRAAMPNFIQTFFDIAPYVQHRTFCASDQHEFTLLKADSVVEATWDFGDGTPPQVTSATHQVIHQYPASGNYLLTAEVRYPSGTTEQIYKKAIIQDPVQVTLGADTTLCAGDTLALQSRMIGGDVDEACVVWQDSLSAAVLNITQPGTYWVEATYNGCTTRDTIVVNFKPVPEVDLGPDQMVCDQPSVTLDATLGGNIPTGAIYYWSNDSQQPQTQVNESGIYWVDVTQNGCTTRDSIRVDFLRLNLGADTVLCQGDSLTLVHTDSLTNIQWPDGTSDSTFVIHEPGVYRAIARRDNCQIIDSIRVDVISVPSTSLDTLICEGEAFTWNIALPGTAYYWRDGSTEAQRSFTEAGTYLVTLENHCFTTRRTLTLRSENCDCDLSPANVFTPNSDGQNDKFFIPLHHRIEEPYLQIYNRWGKQVYHGWGAETFWDGYLNDGRLASAGTYFWTLTYHCRQQDQLVLMQKKGWVTLLLE